MKWGSWPLSRWPVAWDGWLPLTIKPEADQSGKIGGAALAGAMVGGPVGAAAAAGAAAFLWKEEVRGRVKLELTYTPLAVRQASEEAAQQQRRRKREAQAGQATATTGDGDDEELSLGGTEEVDWGDLARAVGVEKTAAALEFCAFVDCGATDTQAALWRDESRKRLVVAFRGTSAPGDLVTDAKILQTPWEALLEGASDSVRKLPS